MPVTTNNLTDNFDEGKADQQAEEINNLAQDRVEKAKADAVDAADKTPTTVEGFGKMSDRAPQTKKKVAEKKASAKKAEDDDNTPDRFEVDLDRYTQFVDRVTSDSSRDFDCLMERYKELNAAGCKISRLDTAASGMSAHS